jgi:hypothetical protein
VSYIFNIVGRRALPHEGYKVKTYKKSIQGPWEANMFNTYPRHGVLEFKCVPKDPLTIEDIGGVRDNVKRKKRETYVKRYKNSKPLGDHI